MGMQKAIAILTEVEKSQITYLLQEILLVKAKKKTTSLLKDEHELAAKMKKEYWNFFRVELKSLKKELKKLPEEDRPSYLSNWQSRIEKEYEAYMKSRKDLLAVMENKIAKVYGKSRSKREEKPTHRTFTTEDKKVTQSIYSQTSTGLQGFYSDQMSSQVDEIIREDLHEGGTSEEFAERITENLGKRLGGKRANQYFDVAASAALVRSQNFGDIFSMEEAGISHYEIFAMMDERTCPVCREMDGRVFETETSANLARSTLEMTIEELKQAMPWQSSPAIGLSSVFLQAAGQSVPPFHGYCRCSLVMHQAKKVATAKQVKKDIKELFPMSKREQLQFLSINQDTRIAEIRGNYASKQSLPAWKLDLLDNNGKIKSRMIYDEKGNLEREVHFTNHGNSKHHPEVPHVHRWSLEDGKWSRNDLDRETVTWEKEMIENISEDKIRKEEWTWLLRKSFKAISGWIKKIF